MIDQADNKLLADYIGKNVKEFTWNKSKILISEHIDPVLEGLDYTHIWQPDSNWNHLIMVIDKIKAELNQPEDLAKLGDPDFRWNLHDVLEMFVFSYIGKCDYTIKDVASACVRYAKSQQ